MVNLGIAFYGRSFTATSPSCMDPGCPWVTGGDPGPCSGTIGVLLNSEIDGIMNETKVQRQGHSKAAVKTLKWGVNQWVSFYDADTFKMKSQRASELCLGGLFVWAVSHDTKYAKYSKALAAAANRKVGTALPVREDSGDPASVVKVRIDQCQWTNCGDGCPPGWGLVVVRLGRERQDPCQLLLAQLPQWPYSCRLRRTCKVLSRQRRCRGSLLRDPSLEGEGRRQSHPADISGRPQRLP